MDTTCDYFTATPEAQAQMITDSKARLARTHRGPDNWAADMALSNRRAFAALAAMRNGTPRPSWGRRNAGAAK